MELKEDAFTRQKIDELSASWEGGGAPNNVVYVPNNNGGNTGGGNTGGGGGGNEGGGGGGNNAGFVRYSRNISFAYPRGSEVVNRPYPQVPMLVAVMRSPDQAATAEVYDFQGASNVNQAMDYLRQLMDNNGMQMNYQAAGNMNGYTVVNGVTSSNGQNFQWIGGLRSRGDRVEGLIVSINNGNPQLARQILATLR